MAPAKGYNPLSLILNTPPPQIEYSHDMEFRIYREYLILWGWGGFNIRGGYYKAVEQLPIARGDAANCKGLMCMKAI